MTEPLYAHTPPQDAPERWHRLDEHLQQVADLAAGFGDAFGAAAVCRALGWAHDLAKADPRFQAYLRRCHEGRPADTMPHAAPSAAAAKEWLGPFSLAIIGHHAGLYDKAEAQEKLSEADRDAVARAQAFADAIGVPRQPLARPGHLTDPLSFDLFLRLCFSALTDADRLDTEAHCNRDRAALRSNYPPIGWYSERLDERLDALKSAAEPTTVNRARAEILAACRAAADRSPGAYRLGVPTGGGKTLASLSFALRHARTHGLRRIVCALPFTSIIDQTADVYGSIFGESNILEHHSAYEPEGASEGQAQAELQRKLAVENWDCPLIVTTTVQLFESLFASKAGRCRKIHRIARSVIVLDEAQTLPPELLAPVLDMLEQLVKHYGCTVLFCTATQPDYAAFQHRFLSGAIDIVPDNQRYFELLRRVQYRRIEDTLTAEQVARLIDAEPQVLCVLNTRKDAVAIARACREDDMFHLSTLLCPAHRRCVLNEVRDRLDRGQPVRLVATQVVEAGVDLDFPKVLRVTGPLDRIVQAAGRCNREGKLPTPGECVIFDLEEGAAPRGWYRTGIELARTMVREDAATIDQPERVAEYFRDLYRYTNTDKHSIQELRTALAFRKVADAFRMIPEETTMLAVPGYNPEEVNTLLARPVEARDRDWYRQIGHVSVSVPHWQLLRMAREGLAAQEPGGYWVYTGIYDKLVGIGRGDEPDPADLVC